MVVDTKLYEILGVDPAANETELKRAYKKMAVKLHPDKNPNDPQATEKFQALNEAYEVLRDPAKRKLYDERGPEGLKEGDQPGMEDILEHIFGINPNARRRTRDIEYELKVSLEDLYNGLEKNIKITRHVVCPQCNATGLLPGKNGTTCETCGGQGRVIMQRGFMQSVATCPNCHGAGQIVNEEDKCPHCHGEKLVEEAKTHTVHVERGMEDGDTIVFQGAASEIPDADTGDLVVIIREKPHDLFRRQHDNLLITRTINLSEALFGLSIVVPHLDGRKLIVRHSGEVLNPGTVKVVEREGMPLRGNSFERGKLFIEFKLVLPEAQQLTKPLQAELAHIAPPSDEVNALLADVKSRKAKLAQKAKSAQNAAAKTAQNAADSGEEEQDPEDLIVEVSLTDGTKKEFEQSKKKKEARQREAYQADGMDDEMNDESEEGGEQVGCAPM